MHIYNLGHPAHFGKETNKCVYVLENMEKINQYYAFLKLRFSD
jgi:hypothetical protein